MLADVANVTCAPRQTPSTSANGLRNERSNNCLQWLPCGMRCCGVSQLPHRRRRRAGLRPPTSALPTLQPHGCSQALAGCIMPRILAYVKTGSCCAHAGGANNIAAVYREFYSQALGRQCTANRLLLTRCVAQPKSAHCRAVVLCSVGQQGHPERLQFHELLPGGELRLTVLQINLSTAPVYEHGAVLDTANLPACSYRAATCMYRAVGQHIASCLQPAVHYCRHPRQQHFHWHKWQPDGGVSRCVFASHCQLCQACSTRSISRQLPAHTWTPAGHGQLIVTIITHHYVVCCSISDTVLIADAARHRHLGGPRLPKAVRQSIHGGLC